MRKHLRITEHTDEEIQKNNLSHDKIISSLMNVTIIPDNWNSAENEFIHRQLSPPKLEYTPFFRNENKTMEF